MAANAWLACRPPRTRRHPVVPVAYQACSKADFMPDVQRQRCFDECTVDAVERYPFDLSETRVSHRVLDPKHANKNALRAIFGQLVDHMDHVADTVKRFVSFYKPGGWF